MCSLFMCYHISQSSNSNHVNRGSVRLWEEDSGRQLETTHQDIIVTQHIVYLYYTIRLRGTLSTAMKKSANIDETIHNGRRFIKEATELAT